MWRWGSQVRKSEGRAASRGERAPGYAQQDPLLGRLRDVPATSTGRTPGAEAKGGHRKGHHQGLVLPETKTLSRMGLSPEQNYNLHSLYLLVSSFLLGDNFQKLKSFFSKAPLRLMPCPITPDPHPQGWLPIMELAYCVRFTGFRRCRMPSRYAGHLISL